MFLVVRDLIEVECSIWVGGKWHRGDKWEKWEWVA